MLIHGQINAVERVVMEDKSILYRCEIIDKAKPSLLRTSGRFLRYIPHAKLSDFVDKVEDLEDLDITICPREANGNSGNITLKGGTIVKGHAKLESLAAAVTKQ